MQARVPGSARGRVHPVLGEFGPVVALAAATVLPSLRLPGFDGWTAAAGVLVWLPALARRRYPVAAFTVTAVLVLGSWGADGFAADRLFPTYTALWVVLFGVADRCDLRRTVAATAVTGAITLLSLVGPELPGQQGPAAVPLMTVTVAVAVAGRNRRTHRAYTAGLEDRAARLEREQHQQARVAVAEERARIAREVHDVVAHNISVMIALADGAGYVADEARRGAAMAQVAGTGRQALSEMGRLLGILRADDGSPSRRPAPGLDDLEPLVEQVRAAGLATALLVRGTPVRLRATAELAVYRLVQEALTNTLKHGNGVRRATVELTWEDDALGIEVRDDGRAAGTGAVAGHGITGMRERFAVWGGTVAAGPRPGLGWQVVARLPLAGATLPHPQPEPVAETGA